MFGSIWAYESSPAFLLYSNVSMPSGTQTALVAARCSEDSNSFMMAEKAGRSLKLHIQQYFIRSYLKACKKNSKRLLKEEFDILVKYP